MQKGNLVDRTKSLVFGLRRQRGPGNLDAQYHLPLDMVLNLGLYVAG